MGRGRTGGTREERVRRGEGTRVGGEERGREEWIRGKRREGRGREEGRRGEGGEGRGREEGRRGKGGEGREDGERLCETVSSANPCK